MSPTVLTTFNIIFTFLSNTLNIDTMRNIGLCSFIIIAYVTSYYN
jgi:hypothetical protein